MVSCDEMTELLSAALDGELSPAEQRELEDHLAHCPACRELAAALGDVHGGFAQLEDVPAPADLTDKVMAQVRAETPKGSKKLVPFRPAWVRRAAGLAACLVLCAVVYQAELTHRSATGAASAEPSAGVSEAASAEDSGTALQSAPPEEDSAAVPEQAPVTYAAPTPETETPSLQSKTREAQPPTTADAQTQPTERENTAPITDSQGGADTQHGVAAAQLAPESDAPSVLTLTALPSGTENLLADVTWTQENGQRVGALTAQQWTQLAALAGDTLVAQQGDGSTGPWTLIVLEEN